MLIKKLIIITLSLQIGFSNTVLQEVFNISYLIEHYKEHAEKSNIGFIAFIQLHYTENEHQNEQNSKHNSLPFHHPVTMASVVIFTIPNAVAVKFYKKFKLITKHILKNDILLQDYLIAVLWHPPKFI